MRRRLLLVAALILGCEDAGGLGALTAELGPIVPVLDFGEAYVGAERSLALELSNIGTGPVRIFEPVVVGAGFGLGEFSERIGPGTGGLIQVRWAPVGAGPVSGRLDFTSDVQGTTIHSVELRGLALPPLDCIDRETCTDDRFDPEGGACVHTPREGDCNDGNACTADDACSEGICVGRALRCEDEVPCTRDLCDPAVGCVHLGDDAACADDDPCTVDRCAPDGCENPTADDGTPCGDFEACISADVCILGACVELSIPEGAPCDDERRCTIEDRCTAGRCVGSPIPLPPQVVTEVQLTGLPDGVLSSGSHLYLQHVDHLVPLWISPPLAFPGPAIFLGLRVDQLLDLGPDRMVRRVGGVVELLDARDPYAPVPTATVAFPGPVELITTVDGVLYACSDHHLWSLEVVDLTRPGPPVDLGPSPCDYGLDRILAKDVVVVRQVGMGLQPRVTVLRVGPTGTQRVLDGPLPPGADANPFEPISMASDGRWVVLQGPTRPAGLLVADLTQPAPSWVALQPQIPIQSLLALEDGIAYFGFSTSLLAFDLRSPGVATPQPEVAAINADPVLARSSNSVALTSGHLAFVAASGRLELVTRAPGGVADDVELRGHGWIGRLVPSGDGLILLNSSGALFAPIPLPSTPATLPNATSWEATGMVWLDGPGGPAGLYARQSGPGNGVSFLSGERIMVRVQADGTILATPEPRPPTWPSYSSWAIAECEGAAIFLDPAAPPRWATIDRCQSPTEVVELASFSATLPARFDINSLLALAHGSGLTTFLGDGYAALVDHAQPLAPFIRAESPFPRTYLSADSDGTHWALTWRRPDQQVALEVYDLTPTGLVQTTSITIGLASANTPVLHLDGPLAYVASGRHLQVYDLRTSQPTATIPLRSEAIDFAEHDERYYLGRNDGITVLEPACAP